MNDPNITMEEYIRIEEEKAQSCGLAFNWQTAKFGRMEHYYEEECFANFKEELPAIVFGEINEFPTIVFNATPPCEPIVSPPNDSELDFRISCDESDDEDYTVHVLDFVGLTPKMRQDLAVRSFGLRVYSGVPEYLPDERYCYGFRHCRYPMLLVRRCQEEDDLETVYLSIGFAYRAGDGKGWVRSLLGWEMIAYSILGRGQAPEKVTGVDLFYLRSMDHGTINVPHLLAQYLFRHAKGRKSGSRLSGGHFIGRLAAHFRLVSDEGLRGLQVVTRELPLIDLHELGRLNICKRYGDTWAWVALRPVREQATAAGAPKAGKAGEVAEEVALEIPAPAPAQAPPPPPLALQPHTMSQRIKRLEEEVHDLRRDVIGLLWTLVDRPTSLSTAPSQGIQDYPSRDVSGPGQERPVPPQPTTPMLRLTPDLFMLLFFVDIIKTGIIMESLVKKKQKGAILELKQRHLKKVSICINTPYLTRKIQRICASSSQERVLINSRSGDCSCLGLRKKYRLILKNDM
ncbi:hypothetical protein Tco_0841732 [Tanacetum coccineum]|uniref:Uncharacterized protein n=1 Tax=Tanacetum coccineum TaxID=301880 RepID=A0ABQ5AXW4_9ASTR